MIPGLARVLDNILGRGDAAVTVPPLDGALRPNRALDEAGERTALAGVDCLAVHDDMPFASAGNELFAQVEEGYWESRAEFASPVTCIASMGADGLAVALDDGGIVVHGGSRDGRCYRLGAGAACITAMVHSDGSLYVACGSATNRAADWQRDLLERNTSGSIWRVDPDSDTATRIAGNLAWPAGLALDGTSLVVSEAWKHRLVRINRAGAGVVDVIQADLPGYPGRISTGAQGHWLALFAPRSQLVEFVLREPAYRRRMMAEVPQPYWVAPRLRSGRSFYESLQGGGVKHLGMLKPWAPTMSAGLCVRLDGAFQPRSSLQSRADGSTHGVTSAVEHRGRVLVAARGDGVIVSCPLDTIAADRGGGR